LQKISIIYKNIKKSIENKMNYQEYNLWMQEWQQELHAQQLLNPTP
jgi:hypothetical protein